MKKPAVFLCILIALVVVTSITVYLSFYYAAKHREETIGSHISQNHIVTNETILFFAVSINIFLFIIFNKNSFYFIPILSFI